ncbi:MAG: hypothetical protein NTX64_12135 [Elusimicrobia bacterium]|nr:hypothetical protein [Elusimicrobiota bacterium]
MRETLGLLLLLAAAPAGAQPARYLAGARATAASLGVAEIEEPAAPPAVPQAVDAQPGDPSAAPFTASYAFPPMDPKTAAWLASRIPGLDTRNVVAVPFETVDAMIARVVDAKGDYLDLLSDPVLSSSQPPLYYLSQDVLARLDAKYRAGTLPVSGTATDGRAFRMQGFVAGMKAIHYLYDQTNFSFKNGSYEFKIGDDGHVATTITGPADITVQGIQGCGHILIFSGCADIQRITKVSPGKVKVQTTRGPQDSDIFPITRN